MNFTRRPESSREAGAAVLEAGRRRQIRNPRCGVVRGGREDSWLYQPAGDICGVLGGGGRSLRPAGQPAGVRAESERMR